jgi:O-antigen/teichoic acid export membrane protein
MNQTWTRYLPAFFLQKLEGRLELQQAIGNTGWLFADRILHMVVGLVVSISVTRYLGPERFGLLSYAGAFVMIFSSIGQLGLDVVVVRNIVRNPSCRDETLGSAFLLKLFGGAAALVLILAAIALIRPGDRPTQMLVGITALGLLFQTFTTIDLWFQSQVSSKYTVYARSAAYLIVCAAKGTLIFLHAPLTAFAWAGVADIVLGSLGLVIAYRISGLQLSLWWTSRTMALELLRDSWPLMFSDILILIYMRVDKVMLGEISGNTELGVYSVAVLIAEMLYFIPVTVSSSIFPSVVRAKGVSEEFFHSHLQRFYNLMAFLAYSVALPVTFLAGWLVPFMFGANYSKAGPMLIGLAWAGVFINLMIARSYYLTAMNWTRLHFVIDFLGCVVNISLNLFLLPRYGGMGAVIASLITYWLVAHGLCFVFKPLNRTGVMMTKAMLYPKFW